MSQPRPGEVKHLLRPYRTWNSPLAMPDAANGTATCTDMMMMVISHVAGSCLFRSYHLRAYCVHSPGIVEAAVYAYTHALRRRSAAAARVTFAHRVTVCGLSLAAGVAILADLLQARTSAPNSNV
jgi:hypothetical protein